MRSFILPSIAAALLWAAASCAQSSDNDGDAAVDLRTEEAADTADVPGEDGACPDGLTDCGGVCVATLSDHANCGECGNACQAAEVCSEGSCLVECPSGREACGGGCVDLLSDTANCGECGRVCPAGLRARAECLSGECSVTCDAGWSDLDGDGSCESSCVPTDLEECNGVDDNCNGAIDEGFPCRSGQTELGGACGACGYEERACGAGCAWGSWLCVDETGECPAGDVETGAACGNCGHEERTCAVDCTWRPWACTGEGACAPGSWESCNECGRHTCSGTCSWGSCQADTSCLYGQTCDSGGNCVDVCGDGTCSLGEYCCTCSGDCGTCGTVTGFTCCAETDVATEPASVPGRCNNMCHWSNVTGLDMTWPGGYCDPNGDGYRDDGDWVRGWQEYQLRCPRPGCPP